MIFNIALHIYNATVHRTRMKTKFNCVSTNKRQRLNRRKTLRGGIISGDVQPQNAISLMSSQDATQLKSQNEIPLESTESHDATPPVTDVLIEKDSPELESPDATQLESPSIPVGPVGPSIPSPDATQLESPDAKILYLENELNNCNAELIRIKYPETPPEIQLRSAGKVPIIKPSDIFAQLKDLNLTVNNPDTRLELLAKMNKPDSSSANSMHLFYKFKVTPPADESEFEAVTSSGKFRMPYPAVLIVRCVLDGDKLKIMAVYAVGGATNANGRLSNTNTFVLTLDNLVKLETETEYLKRNVPNAPIIGKYTNLELTMSTQNSNSSNVDNLIAFIKDENERLMVKEASMLCVGSTSVSKNANF